MTESSETNTPASPEIFVPLNKLKKSPRNARKTPHTEADIEALAASIEAKGMLQNLVVEPELKDGEGTGCYLVTIGEGRRLAHLLRVKRKQIKKTEPIRCRVDVENDPGEISLDENITRFSMHPADQFEAFRDLAEQRGWGAEDIAARFGVSPQVVRQRMRLGAVSPRLMQVYREGVLNLEQLMAFTVTEDHARQEEVFDSLTYYQPWTIRRELTKTSVPARDRRARFVGADAYQEAGGRIVRDLFDDDSGGYFEDAVLVDRLVLEKLQVVAESVKAHVGWKWAEAHIDFPHAHGLRRCYPQAVVLSDEDEARLAEASERYDQLSAGYDSYDDMPEEAAFELGALENEIAALIDKCSAYDPEDIARGGLYVVLNHDGEPRVERGFIRPEDERPVEPEPEAGADDGSRPPVSGQGDRSDASDCEDKPLPDALIRDLTAHRTLGLRLALGEQPDVAMIALTHSLVAQTFYGEDASCLEIRVRSESLGAHAQGIADTKAAVQLAERHEQWAKQLPREVEELWAFIMALDADSRSVLLAHCVALSVNAVKLPFGQKRSVLTAADDLALAVKLDMAAHWTPTVDSYFGRVTKAKVVTAVREAVSAETADRLAPMKKADMAVAAEELAAGTGWLPELLRMPARPLSGEGIVATDGDVEQEADDQAFTVAAE